MRDHLPFFLPGSRELIRSAAGRFSTTITSTVIGAGIPLNEVRSKVMSFARVKNDLAPFPETTLS